MPANIHHGETVDAKSVILSIVATETVIRNTVTVIPAALLPGAVLGLPAMGTIPLPSDLLLAHMFRAPLLYRPVILLLTLLAMLILLPSGLLLLLSCRVVPLLTLLLPLLVLLSLGLLLLLFFRLVLLLTLRALLIPWPPGLLLLLRGVFLLVTLVLPLLSLLPSGLLLLLSLACRLVLLLPFRLGLVLRFRGFRLLILFLRFHLPRVSRSCDSDQQKERDRRYDSNSFHGVPSIAFASGPSLVILGASTAGSFLVSIYHFLNLICSLITQRGFARGSGTIQRR
jgi:hypothetical protein